MATEISAGSSQGMPYGANQGAGQVIVGHAHGYGIEPGADNIRYVFALLQNQCERPRPKGFRQIYRCLGQVGGNIA